ncbi:MAG: hypothetical protein DI586_07880 [Micavibrio aeruginosavorus]|uniref:O-antigen ligase-related domain-containing protein n=1 Tax=Micavibrio aeruginosavorus TaxID=349221 RepID=A0A2W5HMR7_9BACT|nr:MAG: hypothetical protein DI586_07880 [Micavibrio aeruginosavorus]
MLRLSAIRNFGFLIVSALAFIIALIPQDAANPWMMAPVAILSICLILSGRLSQLNYRDPLLFLILLLWLGWTWGAIFSPVPFASKVTLVILSVLPVGYLFALGQDVRKFLYGAIGIITILAFAAIVHILINGYYSRARLFFDDENILGGLIAFVIPMVLNFHFSAQNRKTRILIHIVFAILTGGLLATQSRSAFIGALIGIAFVLFKNRTSISRRSLKLALIPVSILLIALFTTYFGERLLLMLQMDKDVTGRFSLYLSALRMLAIDPLHGVGLGVFHLYYPHYKTLADNSAGFWVHLDPLQWAVETGIGTAIAFYTLFGTVIWQLCRKDLSPLQIGAGASLVTIFTISHINYPFHYTAMALLAGIFLSVFSAQKKGSALRWRYLPAAAITIFLLCLVWTVMQTAPTLYLWTKALKASQNSDMQTYADNLQICIDKGNPTFPACRIEAAGFLIRRMPDPPQDVLTWLRDAEAANPASPEADIWRAQYYLKKNPGNLKLPTDTLHKALDKNPTLWPPRSLLVQILTSQKKHQEAFDILQESRNWQIDRNALDEYYKMERDLMEKLKK